MFFIFSLLIHALFFIPAISNESKTEKSFKQGIEEAGGAKKKQPVTLKIIPKSVGGSKKCLHSYGGTGILSDSIEELDGSRVVIDVPEGYPAYRAGVRAGDYLLNQDELRGKAGTEAEIVIRRGNNIIKYKVIREIICEFK